MRNESTLQFSLGLQWRLPQPQECLKSQWRSIVNKLCNYYDQLSEFITIQCLSLYFSFFLHYLVSSAIVAKSISFSLPPLLGQSTKVWNRFLEGMAAFWIFGKTHRLKTMAKNAASKNTGFTPNLAKNYPRKWFFAYILRTTRDIEKSSKQKL